MVSDQGQETAENVPSIVNLSSLRDFPEHPYRVQEDDDMLDLIESVSEFGVQTPILITPQDENRYYIISGHRRVYAAKKCGLTEIPAIIKSTISMDDAKILMVDSNLQRTKILPSEKAKAYKIKYDALKRKNGRPKKLGHGDQVKNNNSQANQTSTTADKIAQRETESARQIRRYVRIANLSNMFLSLLDSGKLKFMPAYNLSALSGPQQKHVENVMLINSIPTLSGAQIDSIVSLFKDGHEPDDVEESITKILIGSEPDTSNKETLFEDDPFDLKDIIESSIADNKGQSTSAVHDEWEAVMGFLDATGFSVNEFKRQLKIAWDAYMDDI